MLGEELRTRVPRFFALVSLLISLGGLWLFVACSPKTDSPVRGADTSNRSTASASGVAETAVQRSPGATQFGGQVLQTPSGTAPHAPTYSPTPTFSPGATASQAPTSTPRFTPAPQPSPAPTETTTAVPLSCLNASYLADVTIPDNAHQDKGEPFIKTWRVRNSGTCAWPDGTRLLFSGGNQMSAPDDVLVGPLATGETTEISINMTAPDGDDIYEGIWRFITANGDLFGTRLTVVIQVGGEPTPLPTTPPPPSTPTPAPAFSFAPPPGRKFATLEEFWNGSAEWVLEIPDTGLPGGESDTVYRGGNEFWSYLHASYASAGVVDQCGAPVPFPGCTTLWKSTDGGKHFVLEDPVCLFPCAACPCEHGRDHIGQQQYPRVFFRSGQTYLVYEFGAFVYLRTSADGIHWSPAAHVPGTWVWYLENGPCGEAEAVGEHPHIFSELEYDCLVGGPPGLYVEGEQLYVFVAFGRAPGHMGCYVGNRNAGASTLRKCASNPLFGAELGYGPLDALGPAANPYFEFRTISSADVVRLGDHYYMVYEGVRGPSNPTVVDDQFGLGLARSVGPAIDGPWEKYAGNPIVMSLPGNVGVGHADLVIVGDATYLYTATSSFSRGRYVLVGR